jgi:hypothetical protein
VQRFTAGKRIVHAELPGSEEENARVRTVVGAGSPVELQTDVRYVDVTLDVGGSFVDPVPPGWNGVVYVLEGQLMIGDAVLTAQEGVTFEGGGNLYVSAAERARFVLIAGEPHGEPIRQRGSFVD